MADEKYRLSDLQAEIESALENQLEHAYHITAEISGIQVHGRGHAYLELIEKEADSDRLKAKARAVIWANSYRMIKPYFETVTGESLQTGMKIAVSVHVSYHPVFGLSLEIFDIDPEFTLGDLERRRLEVIRRLEEEGVFDMNKELPLPDVPQRMALISSETAAGLEDFLNQLHNNEYGYNFSVRLFPALMQGNEAPASIVKALDSIFERQEDFDVVVIVRGGGSKTDLACFDDYTIAANIAQFPLPVITGIGHERDTSISDMVARISVKTPTAAAEFLTDQLAAFESELDFLNKQIRDTTENIIENEKTALLYLSENFKYIIRNKLHEKHAAFENAEYRLHSESRSLVNRHVNQLNYFRKRMADTSHGIIQKAIQELEFKQNSLEAHTRSFIKHEYARLDHALQRAEALNPTHILKMGYSYTKRGDTVITDASVLKKGDEITTIFRKGSKKSTVSE